VSPLVSGDDPPVTSPSSQTSSTDYWAASSSTLGIAGAGIAVAAWGASGVLAKGIDMDSLAIAAYRFWVYAIAMIVYLALRGSPVDRRVLRHTFPGGAALAVDVALFFSAVKITTIVDATVIGSMQPVVLMAVAGPLFGERIGLRNVAWASVALGGAVAVVLASSGTPEWDVAGDLLAVGAVIGWSAYFVFSKRSKGVITSTQYTAGTAIWVAALSTVLGLAIGQDLSWPDATSWFWLLVMAFGSGILGHSVMNWSLVRIPLWIASLATLLIPVVSSLLAWAFLAEAITVAQGAAMAVVVVALAVIVGSPASSEETAGTQEVHQ
jgi:drug/metabolite transporter (DMT)-like permease